MQIICPECGWKFQAVDVDAVMAERKVIHELLAESRELAEVKAQRDDLADALRHAVARIHDFERFIRGDRENPPSVSAALKYAEKALANMKGKQ